mgnify:CR=1 FL=1
MNNQTIQQIIIDAAEETHPPFAAEVREHGSETVLFGRGSTLDSLGLVTLIAAVEMRLQDATGKDILLVNEDAMSRRRSPFRTIGTLIEYIQEGLT